MIAADLPPLWLPPKPAIIRPAEHALLRPGAFAPATPAERCAIIADLVRSKRLTPDEARRAMFFVPAAMWAQAIKLAFVSQNSSATSGSSFTFTNQTIQPGLVVVALDAYASAQQRLSTATIGGTSAIVTNGPTGRAPSSILAAVMTGTTATIALTFTGSMAAVSIFVYTITGYSSATAYGSNSATSQNVNTLSMNVATPAGGVLIAANTFQNNSTGFAWTGITEDATITPGSNARQACASATGTAANGSYSISVANTAGGNQNLGLAAASWV